MTRDPRIDDYIARQAEFARPILEHLRAAVHAGCPGVEEAIKWGMPHFLFNGAILAGMGAFKAHATFGFRRAAEVLGTTGSERDAMGQFGRLTSTADLPDPATFGALIRKAVALAESGDRPPRAVKPPKPELAIPDVLSAALASNPAARAVFDAFPPSCRREYIEWVVEAKRPETRARRIAQTVDWLRKGKRRNWKYEKC